MSLTRRRFITIAAAAAGVSSGAEAGPATSRWSGRALGSEAQVDLWGLDPEVLQDVPGLLSWIEGLFSLYQPTSELARLNRDGYLAAMSEDFARLMDQCDAVNQATEGRFDPTIQSLWMAYARGLPLEEARRAVGWHKVTRQGRRLAMAPGQQLTLNGIAQGVATDMVAAHLRGAGATKVLVNIGEVHGVGGPWRIGLADPVLGVYGWRSLTNGALATSSPGAMALGAERFHILDPQDAVPPVWSSVTVEAKTAALADAVSTALCLVKRTEVGPMARAIQGVRRVTLVSRDGDVVTV